MPNLRLQSEFAVRKIVKISISDAALLMILKNLIR